MNTRLEAHKCGIGVLTREALVSIGSGPNSTPPPKMRRGDYGDERKKNNTRENGKIVRYEAI